MEQMVVVRACEVGLLSYWPFFIQPIIDNFGPGNMYDFSNQTFSNVTSNGFPCQNIRETIGLLLENQLRESMCSITYWENDVSAVNTVFMC